MGILFAEAKHFDTSGTRTTSKDHPTTSLVESPEKTAGRKRSADDAFADLFFGTPSYRDPKRIIKPNTVDHCQPVSVSTASPSFNVPITALTFDLDAPLPTSHASDRVEVETPEQQLAQVVADDASLKARYYKSFEDKLANVNKPSGRRTAREIDEAMLDFVNANTRGLGCRQRIPRVYFWGEDGK